MIMRVAISDKEQWRIKEAEKYFQELGLETSVENLQYGDYVFDGKVAFEYKTMSDFVASIQDSRVFNEAINQAENFEWHYVLIQGNEAERAKCLAMTKHYHEVNIFQFHGSIASINRYSTVIECYSPFIREAFYKMYIQAKKDLSNKPIVKKFPKKHKNSARNYLAYCVYGVSAKRASDICHMLDLHNLEDLINVTHQQLTSVDGIGEKLADKIIDALNNDTYDEN
jgi:ERCC4-type nuclease